MADALQPANWASFCDSTAEHSAFCGRRGGIKSSRAAEQILDSLSVGSEGKFYKSFVKKNGYNCAQS